MNDASGKEKEVKELADILSKSNNVVKVKTSSHYFTGLDVFSFNEHDLAKDLIALGYTRAPSPAPSIVWPKDRKHAGCCSGNIGHCICGAEEANEMLDACKSAVAKAGVLVALDLSKLKKYSGIYGLPPKEYTLVNVEDLEKFAAPSQEPLDEIKTAKMLWEKSKLKTKFHRDNGAIEYKTVTFREFRVMVRLINLSLGELIAAPSQGVNEELLQALKWCCTELILITNANPHLKGIGYDHAMLKNKDAIATAEKEKTNVHT